MIKPAHVTLLICLASLNLSAPSRADVPPHEPLTPFDRSSLTTLMRRITDRQIEANRIRGKVDPGWRRAYFYLGLMATERVTGDAVYLSEATRYAGEEGKWRIPGKPTTKPATGRAHADNLTIGWLYVELARARNDPSLAADVAKAADEIAAGGLTGRELWWWCDALSMAPPTLANLADLTGDTKYLTLNDRLFWDAVDSLYDRDARLFYRDARFFDRRFAGKPVFWSRGNGWVVAGLARLLDRMPADWPARPRYEALFKDLCASVATLQSADGTWRPNLLAPEQFDSPESSGTALFTFGMAWGVNRGLLDPATFEPVVRRGWAALAGCVLPDGTLGYVQQVAAEPGGVLPDQTMEYGVGAMLLAGEQVIKLYGSTSPPAVPLKSLVPAAATRPATAPVAGRAHAMAVPQRLDDFAWENDVIAFRAYGPALLKQDGPQSGLDVWVKSTPQLVQADWYRRDEYHKNHGDGLDGYHVGTTRGCGGTAVVDPDGKLRAGANYTAYRIVENGPERVVFELDYAPWDAGGGRQVRETKRVTLAAGSHFNRIESTFAFDGPPLDVAAGVKVHPKGQVLTPAGGPRVGDGRFVAEWEPTDADPSFTGTAVILASGAPARIAEIDGQLVLVTRVESGRPLVYLAGGGWSAAGFPTAHAWLAHVRDVSGREANDRHESEKTGR